MLTRQHPRAYTDKFYTIYFIQTVQTKTKLPWKNNYSNTWNGFSAISSKIFWNTLAFSGSGSAAGTSISCSSSSSSSTSTCCLPLRPGCRARLWAVLAVMEGKYFPQTGQTLFLIMSVLDGQYRSNGTWFPTWFPEIFHTKCSIHLVLLVYKKGSDCVIL